MRSPLEDGSWIELDKVDSTQAYAAGLLKGQIEGPHPGVIYARSQIAGRGRLQREWYSKADESLTMSLVFSAYANHPKPWLIGMSVAIAAAATVHCRLAWPNDLVKDQKKLGGVLTDVVADRSGDLVPVVGLGINVSNKSFPKEIKGIATSLDMLGFSHEGTREIAEQVLERLKSLPEPDSWENLRPIWTLFDSTPGKGYKLPSGEVATSLGIGPEGELICSVQGETQMVLAADAIFGSNG